MAERAVDIRQATGRGVIGGAAFVGRLAYFVRETVRGLPEVRIWWPRMMVEAFSIGIGSLFIVLLVSGFAGAVLALQTGYQFQAAMPYYIVGTLLVSGIVLELGSVLTALILAGRIGARYAAELGTMRVTEQIDALESLGRSPASHLIVPRVVAALIMIPALTIVANLWGVFVGYIVAINLLPMTTADFVYGAQAFWRPWDAWYSLIKSFFFGGSIGVISCFMGVNTGQGASGVGRSTTGAVVYASVLILVLDALLTRLLLNQ